MKTRAAVAWEAGKPLEIEEVELDGPKKGEVLVQIKATGVCHTDAFTLSGDDPEGLFPSIPATILLLPQWCNIFNNLGWLHYPKHIIIICNTLLQFYCLDSKTDIRQS